MNPSDEGLKFEMSVFDSFKVANLPALSTLWLIIYFSILLVSWEPYVCKRGEVMMERYNVGNLNFSPDCKFITPRHKNHKTTKERKIEQLVTMSL